MPIPVGGGNGSSSSTASTRAGASAEHAAGATPATEVEQPPKETPVGGHEPPSTEHEEAHARTTGRRVFNPVLALLNRFGTVAPMSEEQREQDLGYRTERAAALKAAFPSMVASKEPFDRLLQQAHKTLNADKRFSVVVRLSGLLLRNNLRHEGELRTGPNRAGPYVAPAAKDVKPLFQAFGATLGALVDEAKRTGDDQAARLAAAWALTVMIRIHPFMDGNGRTARAAMNLALAKAGQQTIDFPVDSERVYKQSVVWQRLKDHMRVFTGERGVGWSMNEGIVPPSGYFDRLARLLGDEIRSTTIASLSGRPDIVALADALGHVRSHGFS
ncbi:MAG: Fic family protein [Deltaproteobacteria bacterium]|nr:Fic family protein [Deltaproteobacteria bacterium]